MRQGRPLYRCVAGVKPNNPPQTGLESVRRLWSNQPSSKIPPACYPRPPAQKSAKSWVLLPQGRPLYRCVASLKPNNLPQTVLESMEQWWSNLPSSKIRPGLLWRPLPEKSAKSCVLMPEGRILYRYVAGVEPNNIPQTELKSVIWSWRNQPLSKSAPACSLRPPPQRTAKS